MVNGFPPHINSVRDGRIVHHPKQRVGGRLRRSILQKQPERGEQLPKWQLGGRVGNIPGLGIHGIMDGGFGINNGFCRDGRAGYNKSHGELLLVLSWGRPPNNAAESGNFHREPVHVREHMFGIRSAIRRIQGESLPWLPSFATKFVEFSPIFTHSNSTAIIYSFFSTQIRDRTYGDGEGHEEGEGAQEVEIERSSTAFCIMCVFLTLIYGSYAALVYTYSEELLAENEKDIQQEAMRPQTFAVDPGSNAPGFIGGDRFDVRPHSSQAGSSGTLPGGFLKPDESGEMT